MIQLGDNGYLDRCETGEARCPFELLDIAKEYHDEVLGLWEFDSDLAATQIGSLIDNPNVRFWKIKKGDKIVGVIAFCITYPIAGGPKEAVEIFWFLSKQYRGSSLALRALKEVEKVLVSEDEVEVIEMTAMESSMVDKVEGYLLRAGYQPSERHYRKLIK